jgi:ArsR family transcriptional regulator
MRAVDGSMLIVEEATRQTNGPFSPEMTEADERVARLAKALGHPARVALLRHLMRLGECVCTDLSDVLPLAHSTAMQHIKVLKEAGLLVSAKEGRNVVYCVDRGILGQLKGLIAEL